MRIAILTDCYLPSPKSGAKHIHDLAIEFRELGHDVTIITACDSITAPLDVSKSEGLRIVRVKMRAIKSAPKIIRAVQEIRLSSVIWRRAGRLLTDDPADMILYYSPTIFFGALVKRLKALWRCPSYLILRDIFPQWAVDAGVLKKGMAWRFFRHEEKTQYDAADVIAVQSHGDLSYFKTNFADSNYRLTVLYNWASSGKTNLPATSYRARLGLENKIVFVYGGNLGVAQDVDNLIRLANNLAGRPEIHFLFVGEGSEVPRMHKRIADMQLRNVHLLPSVSQLEYLAMLSECDVGLLSLDRRLTTHNIPGKLFGYLYWGLPVLASLNAGNDLFTILGQECAGFCFVNGDDAGLTAAALQLADDAWLRRQMGCQGRSLLESTFSSRAAAVQILEELSVATDSDTESEALLAI